MWRVAAVGFRINSNTGGWDGLCDGKRARERVVRLKRNGPSTKTEGKRAAGGQKRRDKLSSVDVVEYKLLCVCKMCKNNKKTKNRNCKNRIFRGQSQARLISRSSLSHCHDMG